MTGPVAITVRPAEDDDASRIADVFGGYVLASIATFVEDPPSEATWRERIAAARERKLPFLVADLPAGHPNAPRGGLRVAGFAVCAQFRPHAAYRYTVEDSVYIAPEATGAGLGGRLLTTLVDDLAHTDVRQVVAVIATLPDARHDTPSIVLHRRLGFDVVGRMPAVGYKQGQWVDTVIMQKDLRPGT
ncbi:GNAT family N-acetyltransferase [Actinomycetospora termitidis]|uniref:N-acetyltransferase family protein n=1 Tax=Actinomycetospora termitidis TaxID=3053470 RepID=A0ABT7M7W6_9PSEU|nr:GNAT family N-acetyltransferase [Actinomycetospora sp. Odt1-22]MDL5156755.1 N-acetyltransferase family protein [Actinomycetospora sp. Odt1-22]